MGTDILGGPYFSFTTWAYCLETAKAFGWQPAGTLPPPDEDDFGEPRTDPNWDGDYYIGTYQTITDDDALNLAAALDRAIAALKGERPATPEQVRVLAGNFPPSEKVNKFMGEITHALSAAAGGAVELVGQDAERWPVEVRLDLLGSLADRARRGSFRIL